MPRVPDLAVIECRDPHATGAADVFNDDLLAEQFAHENDR